MRGFTDLPQCVFHRFYFFGCAAFGFGIERAQRSAQEEKKRENKSARRDSRENALSQSRKVLRLTLLFPLSSVFFKAPRYRDMKLTLF